MSSFLEFVKEIIMHELSIVMNILNTVEENATKHNASVVHEIEMDIGELAGVEFDALNFAISNSPKTGLLKNVEFKINKIKPIAQCNHCNHQFETTGYANPCPKCQSSKTTIIKGNDLKIKSFKID